MLNAKDRGYLLQIIQHSERIKEKVGGITLKQFEENIDVVEIVSFNLIQIGEAANNLSDEVKNRYDKIPWKKVIGLRNHIVHAYDGIDYTSLFNTATINVDELNEYCRVIISDE